LASSVIIHQMATSS